MSTMDAIKAYILEHALRPNDPLPTEATLCEALGVSRSSVREALRQLAALDIIKVQQGRGSFVSEMSLRPLVETLVLRSALDRENGKESMFDIVRVRTYLSLGIASDIVAHMKGTTNPKLRKLVADMTDKAARGERFTEEDKAFHSGLLAFLDNKLIEQLMDAMWLVHQSLLEGLGPADAASLYETAAAHGAMLDAAEAGDLKAYIEAVHRHYDPVQDLIGRR